MESNPPAECDGDHGVGRCRGGPSSQCHIHECGGRLQQPPVATGAADELAMGGRRDICNGLGGNDEIFGDHGNDNTGALGPGVSLFGAGGNDTVEGGTGSDTLGGGLENDYLFAGTGEDDVDGGFGNDYINVSDHVAGNDTVDCGPGTDRVVSDVDPTTGAVDSVLNCDSNFTNVPVSPGGP
jgi:Ca2+-binding RTX toxin-like protein